MTHKNLRHSGFTILEIVIVLAIISLLVSTAAPEIASMLLAEKLKAPARELEAMAITARCDAITEQRLYRIILSPAGFRLEKNDGKDRFTLLSQFRMDQDVRYEIATWPKEVWEQPKQHIWYFPPTGLCEPLRVIFRKGDSYFLQKFSAITGWDQEETFSIR